VGLRQKLNCEQIPYMPSAELILAIREFTTRFFRVSSSELHEATSIPRDLPVSDPEDFEDFLAMFSRKFGVGRPRIVDVPRFFRAAWRERGFSIFDLQLWLTRRPQLYVESITFGELCDIAERGAWPLRYVRPVSDGVAE
jgi:hypothetical protein